MLDVGYCGLSWDDERNKRSCGKRRSRDRDPSTMSLAIPVYIACRAKLGRECLLRAVGRSTGVGETRHDGTELEPDTSVDDAVGA